MLNEINCWTKFDTDTLFILFFYSLSFAQVESAQIISNSVQTANAKAGTIIILFYVYKFIKQTNVSKQKRQRNKHGRTNVDSTYKRSWNDFLGYWYIKPKYSRSYNKDETYRLLCLAIGKPDLWNQESTNSVESDLDCAFVHLYYYSFMLIWIGSSFHVCSFVRYRL